MVEWALGNRKEAHFDGEAQDQAQIVYSGPDKNGTLFAIKFFLRNCNWNEQKWMLSTLFSIPLEISPKIALGSLRGATSPIAKVLLSLLLWFCVFNPSICICAWVFFNLIQCFSAEFTKVATRTAIGFVVMGFVGFFVKLIFIPINNIIVGAS